MRKIPNVEFTFKDDRGILKQLISSHNGFKQLNYATSKKGVSRGGHWHEIATETFFLIRGRVKVDIKNMKTGHEQTEVFKTGDIFIVEPYEKHTVIALEDSEWMAFFDNIINNLDIYKDV